MLGHRCAASLGNSISHLAGLILGANLPPGADPGDADALFGPDVTIKRIRRAKKDVISNYEELRKVLVANDLTALLDDHK